MGSGESKAATDKTDLIMTEHERIPIEDKELTEVP